MDDPSAPDEPPEFGWTEGTPDEDVVTDLDDELDAEAYIGDPLDDDGEG